MIAGLKPYTEYKDAGHDWLGSVPAHWSLLRAKRLFREVDERSETGREELLSVSHITGVTPRRLKNVTMFMAESNVGHKVCRPGDLVINTLWAWMAALGVTRHTGIVSPAYGVYRPTEGGGILPAYADHLLRTPMYAAEYQRRSTGVNSSRLRLYPEQFLRIPVMVPPLDEQAAIVRFLDRSNDRLERAIRAKRKVIALLKERLQVQVRQIVTRGLDPASELKESSSSWFQGIPQDWEMVRSGSMFRLFGGYAFAGTGFVRDESKISLPLLLTPINFDPDGGLRFGSKSTVRFQGFVPDQFCLRKGALVTVLTDLSSKRLILGRAGFVEQDRLLLNQRTARIDIHPGVRSRLKPEYLCWVLNSQAVREQTIATSRGSTVFHTSPARMLAAVWPLPPVAEQVELVEKLNGLERQCRTHCSRLRAEIGLLGDYRARLIADVTTGKLDVREAALHLLHELAPDANTEFVDDIDDPELIDEEATEA